MQHLFGLNVLDKTKDEYLGALAELASDPTCLVFIDTNIVSYMYKLHAAARREFFIWADGLVAAGRLAIPSWCAGEYLARVRDDELRTYLPKSRDQAQLLKALEAMLDSATQFVDEPILKSIEFTGDRDAFLAQFREAIKALKPFSRAFQHQFDAGAVHKEVLKHLGPAVIDSDVVALCEKADKEGPARVAHRIPPAFRDEDKPENKLGDLIIWYEIIEWAKQKRDAFTKVLFVTNDQKSDWVYAPLKRENIAKGVRGEIANDKPRIKIIDPRLVAEFQRLAGHGHITITSLPSLVEGISRVNPTQVGQLAAAIQINLATQTPDESRNGGDDNSSAPTLATDADSRATSASSTEKEFETAATDPTVPVGEHTDGNQPAQEQDKTADEEELTFDEDGYRDAAYEADAPGKVNEVIRALKTLNWYVQNPAIEDLKALRNEESSATSWFVLGRNIYQAACGNAQKAMNFIANLDIQLNRFTEEAADAMLAGMAFEIYFDSQGQLRSDGKAGYLDKVLAVLTSDRYSHVRRFIQNKLVHADAKLLYVPGEQRELALLFKSTEVPQSDDASRADKAKSDDGKVRLLDSITLENFELVVTDNVEKHPWGGSIRDYTADDVCSEISKELLIPKWALKRKFEPSVRPDVVFRLPEGKRLGASLAAPAQQ